MRRAFWVALGATAGVLVVRKLTKTAERLTPEGLSNSASQALGGLGEAVRGFGAQVRAGMAEREAELRASLGLDGGPDDGGPGRNGGPDPTGGRDVTRDRAIDRPGG